MGLLGEKCAIPREIGGKSSPSRRKNRLIWKTITVSAKKEVAKFRPSINPETLSIMEHQRNRPKELRGAPTTFNANLYWGFTRFIVADKV